MTTLLILMFIMLIGYTILTLSISKTTVSYSDTYYTFPRPYNLLFTAFCWFLGFGSIILGFEIAESALMFIAGSGLVLVGAASSFKESSVKLYHYIGAFIAFMCSNLAIAVDFHLWYLPFIVVPAFALILKLTEDLDSVFWLEFYAFLIILIAFAVKIF